MEITTYYQIIKKNLLFILACTAGSAILAYLLTTRNFPGYKLNQTFLLTQQSQPVTTSQQTPLYDYDGFYLQERARNFTDTAVSILESPDFTGSVQAPGSIITVQKLAPQLIKITTISPTADEAKFLIERVAIAFNQKLQSLQESKTLQIKAIGAPQEPQLNKINQKVIIVFGIVVGAALGVFVTFLKNYFKL